MSAAAREGLLRTLHTPWKFKAFLWSRLPAAAWSGLRLEAATSTACTVSVPFGWRSQNPFRSTYFACLSMAAEMSTGIPALLAVTGSESPVSMLVTGCEASFSKKATGKTLFTCAESERVTAAVEAAVANGEAQTITVESIGKNEAGELVATFRFTWSFLAK